MGILTISQIVTSIDTEINSNEVKPTKIKKYIFQKIDLCFGLESEILGGILFISFKNDILGLVSLLYVTKINNS